MPDITWSEASPTQASDANQIHIFINQAKTAIRERLQLGGMYFPSTHDDLAGEFSYIRLTNQSSGPTPVAGKGFVFVKEISNQPELFFMSSSGEEVQITSGNGVLGVPTSGIIIYDGDSCPTGYTQFATLDGKFLVGSATRNYAGGGANTKDLRHVHTQTAPTLTTTIIDGGNEEASAGGGSGLLGNLGEHEHSVAVSAVNTGQATTDLSAVDIRPVWSGVVLCKKT